MRTRILIYGGTSLNPPQRRLVEAVVRRLLQEHPDVVILSGGFWKWDPTTHPDRQDWVSVDQVVRETVLQVVGAGAAQGLVSARLET